MLIVKQLIGMEMCWCNK